MSSPYQTVALHTLGCKVNFTETSTLSNDFLVNGISVVPFEEYADIYVINTCSVTENANLKCEKLVRYLKRRNPDSFIVITGCYAQLKPDELSNNENIDLVIGTENKMDIVEIILDNHRDKKTFVTDINDIQDFSAASLAIPLADFGFVSLSSFIHSPL